MDKELNLAESIDHIQDIANGFGLDFFPTHFYLVPAEKMYEYAAYGIPGRFGHWTHGRAYHQMKTMYDYGLSKIYELVINSNPSQAFLLANNSSAANKLVAAHVLAHNDFFKHNVSFTLTNRQMVHSANLNAERISSYEFKHGFDAVEKCLDSVLSISQNIDPNPTRQIADSSKVGQKLVADPYEDLLTPEEKPKLPEKPKIQPVPTEEEQDLLGFISRHSPLPLQEWQIDILEIVRIEMQYFLPQMKTKIMNEGWASLWHSRIMRAMEENGFLSGQEGVEWIRDHSGVITPNRFSLNPYFVGIKVWEDIDRRFKGELVKEDFQRKTWWGDPVDPRIEIGSDKFDINKIRSDFSTDQGFLAQYLTPKLIKELDLYEYGVSGDKVVVTDTDPDTVKQAIYRRMTNFGLPVIKVVVGGGDYKGNRELYLKHCFEETALDKAYAKLTMENVYALWGRPVHLETVVDKKPLLMSFDGKNWSEKPG